MKSFRYIATLAVAAAGLATQADTIPITYSYTGANFTFGTGPIHIVPESRILNAKIVGGVPSGKRHFRAGHRFAAIKNPVNGTVNEANNRDVPGTWSSGPATVPDQGATLTLICLALITLLGFKYAQGPNDFAS